MTEIGLCSAWLSWGRGEWTAVPYVQTRQATCKQKKQEEARNSFTEGKRKLKGETVKTIVLCCKHRGLPIGLSVPTQGVTASLIGPPDSSVLTKLSVINFDRIQC